MKRQQISRETKKKVWDKCNGQCWYCGKKVNPFFMHYDHIHPHSKGGSDEVENLALACPGCNWSKKDMTLAEWRVKLSRSYGLAMPKYQIDMLRSEGINVMDNPYAYEPVLLFYFERDIPEERRKNKHLGYDPYYTIINYQGWK